MKVIAGLGNPGRQYRSTPHNVGFAVADELARRWGEKFTPKRRESAEALETFVRGEKVLLAKPMTFMNLSGHALRELTANRPVEHEDLLIILDEANLKIGRLRIRPEGSHGGHNGLRSVIESMGGNDIPRLRIGVQPNRPIDGMTDFVLGSMRPEERRQLEHMVQIAADAAEHWIEQGAQATSNRFNGLREFEPEGGE